MDRQNLIRLIALVTVAHFFGCLTASVHVHAQSAVVLQSGMKHLRAYEPREWTEFPASAEAAEIELQFDADPSEPPGTLRWRQQDIKQTWKIVLNEVELGRLPVDENDQIGYVAIPAGTIRAEANLLQISQQGTTADDVRIGELSLDRRPIDEVLTESRLTIRVRDVSAGPGIPCRITILNAHGALQPVRPADQSRAERLAIRAGIIYSADGTADLSLPAGNYTVYAGRGVEYSIARGEVSCQGDGVRDIELAIARVIPTPGYVACDPHVHTFTYSRHGDATALERVLTIAGEGIELPIATDHNLHVDLDPFAVQAGVRSHFTPVIGNEVTTRTGHFNAFPISPDSAIPDHRQTEWGITLDGIFATPDVRVVILNHARDLHSGTRPFGPKLFNEAAGVNVENWPMKFNAMEVVNSGATQTDPLRLFHDWMVLLNRGLQITPVGSSDSHDVGRHFVGQGRTYVRCPDKDPGGLDVDAAVRSFLDGHVMVSYGLLVRMQVNGHFSSGDLAPQAGETIDAEVSVFDPGWSRADRLLLYANGELIAERTRDQNSADAPTNGAQRAPSEWKLHFTDIPCPTHDVHLVAIATGPGVKELYWPTAKSYQPTSPDWRSFVMGCSGAVWVDADGDGRRSAAVDIARKVIEAEESIDLVLQSLNDSDAAVAIQAAELLDARGVDIRSESFGVDLMKTEPHVQSGFQRYLTAWRANQIARSGGTPPETP